VEYVYFIATGGLRFVKIGFSKDPQKRLLQLKTGNPLDTFLLGTLPGGRICESLLHLQFSDLRALEGSEWFKMKGRLLAYLEMKGLHTPIYADCTPRQLREARVIRRAGWDTFTHEDLDRILVEPASAWQVYYGVCGRGINEPAPEVTP